MAIRLSVIIPVYNAAKYLRECLDSIVAQTFIDFEAICVDDGSTDESGEVLDGYAARDGRIKIVHQKNAGAWAARNAALEIAQGEYVTFVDSDDVLNKNWFCTGIRLVKASGADLVRLGCHYGHLLPNGFAAHVADDKFMTLDGATASAWMWDMMTAGGYLWRCFIRRSVIVGLEFLPRINCKEDSIWLLALAQRVKRVAESSFAGYFYRATDGSLMKRKRKVSQCVGYLEALGGLWMQQKDQAERDGYVDIVKKNIRASADNDVIEWAMKCAQEDDLPRKKILEEYGKLASAGAFEDTRYTNRWRYGVGFIWWKRTGQIWMMLIPGMFFLFMRMMISKIKG